MDEFIYSRKKIKFPKFKKLDTIKMICLFIIIIIIMIIIVFFYSIYPIFESACIAKANSVANNIVNNEVNNIMKLYNYSDLINLQKDNNGKISLISANIVTINNIVADIISSIQQNLDANSTEKVYMNLGKISGFSFLSYIGPKVTIELERTGKITYKINSKFKSVGINQTLHQITLELNCKICILTPFETMYDEIQTEVLLTETVIMGEVPEGYYDGSLLDADTSR